MRDLADDVLGPVSDQRDESAAEARDDALAAFGRELSPLCGEQGISVLPYGPLAGGLLPGKYRQGQPPPDSVRAGGIQERYYNDRNFAVIEKLDERGKEHGKTVLQMALGWLLSNPVVTSPIVGANTVEQLENSLGAVGLRLSDEEKATLDEMTAWE